MKKIILSFFILSFVSAAHSQSAVSLVSFSTGYSFPLDVESCGDSRLFIVQKGGQIMVCDSLGKKNTTPFLDISDRVDASSDEIGLLGLAFSPKYTANGLFYVNYIDKSGNTKISQFKVSSNKNVATASSEKVVLTITQNYRNHVGGCIKFGPDGFLYIGVGDGDGSAVGDPLNYAQNKTLLQGKMLRIKINTNGTYSIPASNPFVDSANYRKEIWAIGLRNPWRFSFDAANGNLFIGDVGEALWEEVDIHLKKDKSGENYGWHCYEGNHAYNTAGCKPMSAYTFPKYEYTHSSATGDCAITGGYVYRGKKYPDLTGKYFFTDFCSGIIRMLTLHTNSATETDVLNSGILYSLTSFGEDSKHEIYVVSSGGEGAIYRLASTANLAAGKSETPISMMVYPNPANGRFSVKYTTAKAEECVVTVYEGNGREVYSEKKLSAAGDNIWTVILPDFVKGNCYVKITSLSGSVIRQNIVVK